MSDATATEGAQEAASSAVPENAAMIAKKSHFSVKETQRRLEKLITKQAFFFPAGMIEHSERALEKGFFLNSMVLLMVSAPKLDSKLLEAAPTLGIDLPLKMLIWQDNDNQVWLAIQDLKEMAHSHGVTAFDPLFEKLSGALDRLANAATGNTAGKAQQEAATE